MRYKKNSKLNAAVCKLKSRNSLLLAASCFGGFFYLLPLQAQDDSFLMEPPAASQNSNKPEAKIKDLPSGSIIPESVSNKAPQVSAPKNTEAIEADSAPATALNAAQDASTEAAPVQKPKAKSKPKVQAQEENVEKEEGATALSAKTGESVTGGEQFEIYEYAEGEKSFKMTVPSDWNKQKDYSGYALFMEPKQKIQPTPENPVVGDPNLTVSITRNPMFIDQESLEEFSKELQEKFTQVNGASELQVFKETLQELPGNRKGLLYYFTYKKNNYDVMSAILVVSNKIAMYKVTLTDYKVGFDKNLEKYFPIMASVVVEGEPLIRESALNRYWPFLAGIGGLMALIFAGRFISNRREKTRLRKFMKKSKRRTHSGSRAPDSQYPDNDDAEESEYSNSSEDSSSPEDLEDAAYRAYAQTKIPKKASKKINSADVENSSAQFTAAESSCANHSAPASAVVGSSERSGYPQSEIQSQFNAENTDNQKTTLINSGFASRSSAAQSYATADSEFAKSQVPNSQSNAPHSYPVSEALFSGRKPKKK